MPQNPFKQKDRRNFENSHSSPEFILSFLPFVQVYHGYNGNKLDAGTSLLNGIYIYKKSIKHHLLTMAAWIILKNSRHSLPIFQLNYNSKISNSRGISTRLAEVGKFETPKVQGKYEGGQLFLHRVFGYRGVILFPWVAKLYDRDLLSKVKDDPIFEEVPSNTNIETEIKATSATYYQTLIDERDCPYIRTHPEAVTFLGNPSDTSLYTVPGLDYVNHADILPYISTCENPIQHDLFGKFLQPNEDKVSQVVPAYTPTTSLRLWHEKNHRWLELSDVHRETTEDIRITVIPFCMGSRTMQQNRSYWWRYSIRLENLGMESVQVRERHWRIFSLSGTLETVRGRGVIGQEPVLSSRQPAFQYSSHVSLQSPSGHMWGTYRLERPDGSMFDVRIPPFSLECKEDEVSDT